MIMPMISEAILMTATMTGTAPAAEATVKKSTRKKRISYPAEVAAEAATTTAETMNILILLPAATSGEKPPSMPQW